MSLETHPDLPSGAYPCFLAAKTQEIHGVLQDEDVTEEKPWKFISVQGVKDDMMKRAAVCDFSPFKDLVNKYEGEEILVVYDFEFAFGQNFYICLTTSAKDKILENFQPKEEETAKPKKSQKEGSEGGDEDAESSDGMSEFEGKTFVYQPPKPQEWISKENF